jgi:hypothetical protein
MRETDMMGFNSTTTPSPLSQWNWTIQMFNDLFIKNCDVISINQFSCY